MKTIKLLTDKEVRNLKAEASEYMITEADGFYLRVLPSGVKTFWYRYTYKNKRCKMNLGQYPDVSLAQARDMHVAARLLVRQGRNPSEPLPVDPEALTVAALAEAYLKHSKDIKAGSTYNGEKTSIERLVVPAFENRLVKNVSRRDAIDLIKLIVKVNGGGMAAQTLKHARCMFGYALEDDLIEYNPFSAIGSAVPAAKNKNRDRALSDKEIKYLWEALVAIKDPRSVETRRALLLTLVTGQRPGEVCGIHRQEISAGAGQKRCVTCQCCGWWTIPWPRIKTRSKREKDHSIYLSPLAIELIGKNNRYIFVGPRDASRPLQEQALSHFVRDHKHFGLSHWTPNDLRRTCATGLSRLGCSDEIIDAILNHVKKGVISVYNQNEYLEEKEEWLMRWSLHLRTLIAND